jgi:hypothetical protein
MRYDNSVLLHSNMRAVEYATVLEADFHQASKLSFSRCNARANVLVSKYIEIYISNGQLKKKKNFERISLQ